MPADNANEQVPPQQTDITIRRDMIKTQDFCGPTEGPTVISNTTKTHLFRAIIIIILSGLQTLS